jgi:molecular chaperone GrpE
MSEEEKKDQDKNTEITPNIDETGVEIDDGNGSEIDIIDEDSEPSKDTNGNMQEMLDTAKRETEEANDRYLRALAELDNYKKRAVKEKEGIRKFANESLIKQILTVVDNLERAIDHSKTADNQDTKKDVDQIVEGVELTLKEILKILEKSGVCPIESIGKDFDPNFHEAVMQEETAEKSANIVLRELQKGYLMHERLLRPAMVIVSKPGTGNGEDTDTKPS